MKKDMLKVAVADPSMIVRSGLAAVLKRISSFRIQPFEISSVETLVHYLRTHNPDVLIINPTFWGVADIQKLRSETEEGNLKCMALVYSVVDENLLKNFDDAIGVYDTVEQIGEKLDKLFAIEPEEPSVDEANVLSAREKEIVVAVVKGLTNREIAEQLFLSTHTVISHRRNVARKLEIHSTAGLTIYAIVNKLVELDEIKKNAMI